MSRSRIVFFLIIAVALLLIAIPRALQLLPTAPTATPLPPLSVNIAVSPLAYDWVSAQVTAFNNRQPQIDGRPAQITVTSVDGVTVWQTGSSWTTANHPVGWIPEASFVLDYVTQSNASLRYEAITPSLASTTLVWGTFADRATVLGTSLDWTTFQNAAVKESWSALGGASDLGFVKPAFNAPQNSTAGYGALLTAAAAFAKTDQLTDQTVQDRAFIDWITPVIQAMPSSATLGSQIAATIASRGSSVLDFALLPESEWVNNYAKIRQPIQFTYPGYNVNFNLPLAVWSGAETTTSERTLLRQFSDFLLQSDAQRQAASFGLRPANLPLANADTSKFNAASAAGIKLDAVPSTFITAPSRSGALSLIGSFRAIRPS